MSNESAVVVRLDAGVLSLTLNRPDKLNAITYPMINSLLRYLEEAAADPDVRTVLLRGAGRSFSAGDDLVSMGEVPRALSPGEHPVEAMQQLLIRRWYWLRKPTVVAIRGRCHGMAHDLALAADFRVVSKTAIMGDIRSRRALPVGSGGTFLLPWLIGLAAATKLMLTGDTIDSDEIERLGLASVVVDDDAFDDAVAALAARLAAGPTKALGILKYQMRRSLGSRLEDALELELSLLDEPVEDRREGRLSFLEGRAPSFTGR
jgi:2-(1,2-epoxy-1,2-dihydrophenyl)acetyl-CoA isomerase